MTTKKGIIYGYLRLQGLRIRRKIVEWGLPFPIGLGIFVVGFVAFSLYIMAKSTWGPTLYALLALSGVTTFSETRRRDFLKSVFSAADYRLVRLLENALLVIPFVVMLSIKGDTWIALALLGAAMASVFWPMKGWNLTALPTPFSKKPFEYAVGFRKT